MKKSSHNAAAWMSGLLSAVLTACSQNSDAQAQNPLDRLRTPPSAQQRLDRLADTTAPHSAGQSRRLERQLELAKRHARADSPLRQQQPQR